MMKNTVKLLAVLMAVCMLFAGCKGKEAKNSFSQDGLYIAFPDIFVDYCDTPLAEGYDFLFAGDYVGVLGSSSDKNEQPEGVSDLRSYAEHKAQMYGAQLQEKDGFLTASYEDLEMNDPQMYVYIFVESKNCYWSIGAYCMSDSYENNAEMMWKYITAVEVK